MKRIDRLLIKANKAYNIGKVGLYIAFVEEQEDKSWKAQGQLWNGEKGSGVETITSRHTSQEEAVEAIHKLAIEYPNKEDIVIFIKDYGFNEEAAAI